MAQLLAVVCVLLVMFGSVVQATHVHPDSDRHDCSLCSVAQASTLITPVFHAIPSLLPARMEAQAPPLVACGLAAPAHSTRPPPSV